MRLDDVSLDPTTRCFGMSGRFIDLGSWQSLYVDEAGRGACAGPLVIGAAILDVTSTRTVRTLAELGDSKQLTAAARERVYDQVTKNAISWATVIVPPDEVDRIGLHVANIEGHASRAGTPRQ